MDEPSPAASSETMRRPLFFTRPVGPRRPMQGWAQKWIHIPMATNPEYETPPRGARPEDVLASVRGRRLFIAGSIVLLLFSAVHMIPTFNDLLVEPTKPVEIEAKRAMAAVAVDMGPFHTNWLGLNRLLSASYSALLFFVVALNLVALPAVIAHGRLPALATVNAIFVGILLVIALIYRFPPPAVFALAAEVLVVGAMIRARRVARYGET